MDAWTGLQQLLPDLVEFLERKVPYAYAQVARTRELKIRVSHSEKQVRPEATLSGVVIGVFNGCQFYEWASSETHYDKIASLVEAIAEHIPSAGSRQRLNIDPGKKMERSFTTSVGTDPDEVSLRDKLDWCLGRHDEIKKHSPHLINADVNYSDFVADILFVNRNKLLSQKLVRTEVMAMPYLSQGGRTLYNFEGQCKARGFELTESTLNDDELKKLVQDTERLLSGSRIQPGLYDIVMDPGFSGLLAHEAFGHGMETDMFLKGRAKGADFIGQQVASPLVNMFDNPTLPGEAGTFFFDDEGWLAENTPIIDKGILKGGMTDCFSATLLGLKRTANGRRESVFRKPYARMTNTYFEAGKSTVEQLISGVEHGYYLAYPTNGMEDPKGWGMQLEGLWAQEIKSGRLTDRIFTPVIVTGFVPDVLKSITGVANDFRISGTGYCGKGHKEYLKNTTGGPSLRLRARLA